MLTEKQFFELIKALQSSNFSTTEILGLSFAIIIVALIVNFIVSFITEKAKISATNANYEILRKQLALNTTTIKDIEKNEEKPHFTNEIHLDNNKLNDSIENIKKEEKSKILKEIYAEELPKIREEIEQKERPKIVERIIQEETAIMADKITKEIKTESYNNGWENGYAEAIKKVKNDIPSQINDLVANVFGLVS